MIRNTMRPRDYFRILEKNGSFEIAFWGKSTRGSPEGSLGDRRGDSGGNTLGTVKGTVTGKLDMILDTATGF